MQVADALPQQHLFGQEHITTPANPQLNAQLTATDPAHAPASLPPSLLPVLPPSFALALPPSLPPVPVGAPLSGATSITQALLAQTPDGHALPHRPQLASSAVGSTHLPAHRTVPSFMHWPSQMTPGVSVAGQQASTQLELDPQLSRQPGSQLEPWTVHGVPSGGGNPLSAAVASWLAQAPFVHVRPALHVLFG